MLPGWRRAATVTAVLFVGCTSSPEIVIAPTSPVATGASTENLTIEGLDIDEPRWKANGANWRLVLTWQAPAGLAVDHYEVRRDGVTVAGEVGSTKFRDDDVEPGSRYRYSVAGFDALGQATLPAVETIKTGGPAVAEARLEGSFVVRMVVERASGTRNPVRGGAIFYSFDPACSEGACSVRWAVRRSRAEGTLRRDGAEYTATLRTPFFVRNCFGRLTEEKVDIRLRVTGATALRHAWRATKIEGSIVEVSSHPGCATASIDWDVRGALQN